jgi:hypothetical protein
MDARVAALEVGTSWVGGRARGSGAGQVHDHMGGVVLGELQVVVAVWSPSWWRPSTGVGDGEDMPRGNPRPGFSWATAAASTNVVSFLKASLRLLLDHTLAPGENPRSSDRAVTAFFRRA